MAGMFEGSRTLEDVVSQAIEYAIDRGMDAGRAKKSYPHDAAMEIKTALLFRIRAWMDDIAQTIMDGPGSMPETVKAEDKRIIQEAKDAQ